MPADLISSFFDERKTKQKKVLSVWGKKGGMSVTVVVTYIDRNNALGRRHCRPLCQYNTVNHCRLFADGSN